MDTSELIKEPVYFFPELLPYLRKDLLPGINELLDYAEHLRIDTDSWNGLVTRIEAMRDDLTNALAGVHAGETEIV